jgi:hypothetical protein
MVLRVNSAACGTGCHCKKEKAICADVVCAPNISAKYLCVGSGQCDDSDAAGGLVDVTGNLCVDQCLDALGVVVPGTGDLTVVNKTTIGTDVTKVNLAVTGDQTITDDIDVGGNLTTAGNASIGGEIISFGITPPAALTIVYTGGIGFSAWDVTSYTENSLSFVVSPNANVPIGTEVSLEVHLPPLSSGTLLMNPTFSLNSNRDAAAAFFPCSAEMYITAGAAAGVFSIFIKPVTGSALWPSATRMGFNVQYNIYSPP